MKDMIAKLRVMCWISGSITAAYFLCLAVWLVRPKYPTIMTVGGHNYRVDSFIVAFICYAGYIYAKAFVKMYRRKRKIQRHLPIHELLNPSK